MAPMEPVVKRILALGATGALVVLALVGALPDPAGSATTFPPVRPTRVLVLGDSVMKGAEGPVIASLPGREVVFDSEVNRSTGQGADIVAQRGGDWDVAIVFLGHNDGGSPGAYQPAARSILEQLRDVPYVSWLTIHEVRPYYPGVNQFIAGLQAEYPNLHVGDWNAIANAHPEGVSGDGLHLNAAGAQLMAGLVTEQVTAGEQQWNESFLRLAAALTTTTAPPTTTTTAPPTTTSTSTSTSTTTTTEAATTTTKATSSSCARAADDGRAVTDCTAEPDQVATSDVPWWVFLGGAALGLAIAGTGLRMRRRRQAQRDADLAG
jgi:lysophospholipase L1-like esterase